jgi:hypothetical protein
MNYTMIAGRAGRSAVYTFLHSLQRERHVLDLDS